MDLGSVRPTFGRRREGEGRKEGLPILITRADGGELELVARGIAVAVLGGRAGPVEGRGFRRHGEAGSTSCSNYVLGGGALTPYEG